METRLALTADVKNELSSVLVSPTTVRAAELATIRRFSGGLHLINTRIAIESELDTPQIVRRVRKDLTELYGVRSAVQVQPGCCAATSPPPMAGRRGISAIVPSWPRSWRGPRRGLCRPGSADDSARSPPWAGPRRRAPSGGDHAVWQAS